jgi:hypothetical protein
MKFPKIDIKKITNKLKSTPKKVWLSLAMTFLIIIPAAVLLTKNKADAAWWNDSWSYRKQITINSNGNSNLTDFQVSFLIDTATLITNQKLQSSCNDIRVTDINGKLIPYWVEEGAVNGCNTANTKIWTKVPIINTSNSNIFVYYGNSTAPKAQSGDSTFEFFDDFSLNQVDTNTDPNGDLNNPNDKWTTGTVAATSSTANYTVGGGVLSGGNTNKYIETKRKFSGNYAVETRVNNATAPLNGFIVAGFYSNATDHLGSIDHNGTSYYVNNGARSLTGYNGTNKWSKDMVKVVGTVGGIRQVSDSGSGVNFFSINNGGISNESIRLGALYDGVINDQDYSAQWDWVFVRKGVVTDPTTSVSGTEQYTQGPIQYFKFDEGYGLTAKNSAWQKFSGTMNLILNPSFEHATATSNWTVDATNFTSTGSIEQKLFGAVSVKSVKTATSTDNWTLYSSNTLGASGYIASAYIYIPSGGGAKSVCISDQGFTNTSVCADDTKRDQWQRISTSFNIASTIAGLIVIRANGFATNEYFYQDGFQLEPVGAITPYCDGSVNDASGTHAWNGTVNASISTCDVGSDGMIYGARWKTDDQCISGKCLAFNGTSSDYITVPVNNINIRNTQGITTSVWVKSNDVSQNQTIFSENGPFFMYMSGGLFNVGIYNGTWQWVNGTTPLKSNTWYNFSLTYDGSTVKSYINGKIESSFSAAGSLPGNASSNMYMGYPQAAGVQYPLNGFLDEVKVYGYARSAAQILLDYNAISNEGTGASFGGASQKWLSEGLVGHWKMDEASWNGTAGEIKDASGSGNNGISVNSTTTTTGKFGNGGVFNGALNYAQIPDSNSLDFTGDMTASFWVKPGVNQKTYADIFSKHGPGGYTLEENGLNLNQYYFAWDTTGAGGYTGQAITSSLTPNVWQLFTVVKSGANITHYINGVQAATGVGSSANIATNSLPLNFSELGVPGGRQFTGSMDEIRFYNRALSPQEVSKLYAYAPGPVGYWNFDENNGIMINDISGNGNSAKTTNNPLWTNGKIGSALSFPTTINGLAEVYAGTSSSLDFTNTTNFTVGAWIKRVTKGSGWHVIAVKGDVASDKYWDFYTQDDGTLQMQIKDGTTTANYSHPTKTVAADGKWHYVSVTVDHDANNVIFSIDGVFGSQINGFQLNVLNNISVPAYPLRLGNWNVLTNYGLAGYLDDVKIYNYVRSPEQIMQDMGGLAPNTNVQSSKETLGYWKFDEGSGTVTNNSGTQGSTLNGTLNNATWSNDGKFNKAVNFSGATNNYVQIPAISSLSAGKPFTISLWAKTQYTGPTLTLVGYDSTHRLLISGSKLLSQQGGYDFYSDVFSVPYFFNNWRHIVYWNNGSEERWYIDGKQTGAAHAISNASWDQAFKVGQYDLVNYPYSGIIDELKVYNYALGENDITNDYNQGAAVKMSGTGTLTAGGVTDSGSAEYCVPGDSTSCNPPVGEWKFDENKGNTVADSSGNGNNGTWNTSNATHWTDGKISGAGKFKYTTSAQMTIDPSTGLPNDYNSANDTNTFDFVSTPITTDPTSFTVSAWAKIDTNNALQETVFSKFASGPYRGFFLRHLSLGTSIQACIYNNGAGYCVWAPIDFGKWTHWTMSFNGTTLYLYKNGVLAGSLAGAMQAAGVGTPFIVGANYVGTTEQWGGLVDQVRYYNYLRTPAQIEYDFNRGGPIGWWKMDECQGNTINDASGQGNNGTLSVGASGAQTTLGTCSAAGSAWGNGASGKFGSSLKFDGTDDWVDMGNKFSFERTDPFSVSFFIKAPPTSSQYISIINKLAWVVGNKGWRILSDYTGNGFIFTLSDNHGVTDISLRVANALDNTWHHVVFTYDGNGNTNGVKGYLDGVLQTSGGGGNLTTSTTNSVSFTFGGSPYAGGALPSQSDDIRVYNYALTDKQVANILNEGSALRFGPQTGSAP